MATETIKEKINKLLNLANHESAAPGEAENALLAAQRLMLRHRLSVDDIGEARTETEVIHLNMGISKHWSCQGWCKILHAILAENFRCFPYFNTALKRLFVIGLKDEAEIVRAADQFLLKFALRAQDEFWEQWYFEQADYNIRDEFDLEPADIQKIERGIKNDWIHGFLLGIRDKFAAQVDKEHWDVIVRPDPAVTKEVENGDWLPQRQRPKIRAFNEDAAADGYNKGRAAQFRKGLEDRT